MFTIIDTIEITDALRSRSLDVDNLVEGTGLLVILDPSQTASVDPPHGQVAVIERPDGSTIRRKIDEVAVHHSVLGFFFKGMPKKAVPRGSRVDTVCEEQLSEVQ